MARKNTTTTIGTYAPVYVWEFDCPKCGQEGVKAPQATDYSHPDTVACQYCGNTAKVLRSVLWS